MDLILAKIESLGALIDGLSGSIIIGAAFVVEIGLRFVKSEKALGLIHGVSALLRKVAKGVELVAGLVGKVAALSDKIIPQRLK
jgi:hypothetical protein